MQTKKSPLKKTTPKKKVKAENKKVGATSIPEISITESSSTPLNPVIVKIKVGNKYFIAKTHNADWLLKNEIANKVEQYKAGKDVTKSMYYPLIQFIAENPQKKISTQLLFEDKSGYKVIKYEFDLLQKSVGKKGCLNLNNMPHVPLTRATKDVIHRYTWFTESDRANYAKYLKKKSISI